MKIILAGGGTGGHIYPAIAVADTIKSRDKSAEILFIATKKGMEKTLVEKAGYKTAHIEMSGLQRSLSLKNIKTAICFFTSQIAAKKLLKAFQPDVVFATGNYLSYPLIHTAAKMGIPTAIHESNIAPGRAIRMLEKDADVIFINFPSTADSFGDKSKVMCVGNPMRTEGLSLSKRQARAELDIPQDCEYVLLSFGGSLGARAINNSVIELMEGFSSKHPEIFHIHSTGKGGYDAFMRSFREKGLDACKNLRPAEYIYDMPKWEAAADAVICRSGAMTVSELALMGKACVFIPSPNVTENHQFKNAEGLKNSDAALLIEEKNLNFNSLSCAVHDLLFTPLGAKLSENIRAFAKPEARDLIYRELVRLSNRELLSIVGKEEANE